MQIVFFKKMGSPTLVASFKWHFVIRWYMPREDEKSFAKKMQPQFFHLTAIHSIEDSESWSQLEQVSSYLS